MFVNYFYICLSDSKGINSCRVKKTFEKTIYYTLNIIIYCINIDYFEENIMNLKELVTGAPGDRQFLLGNEAAVRGVIEAGVSIAATYPGTPSSEIGNVLSVLD